ncbi:MAG: outer membrane lipoprotein carrier protein LolA [Flavobacteriales bacterium]|nr:outer membrane lipoprotein carrier protein LolA [Flavobacteriales bacterium]
MPKIQFLLFLLLPIVSFSQEWKTINSDNSSLAKLKTELASMESIKGDIRQEKSFSFLTEKLVSTGVFIYKKETKLRWEFTDPIEYIILINENSMRLKEEGEEKKYKGMNQILRQVKEIILGCIDGSIMDNANYRNAFAVSDDMIRIQLHPKEKNLREFIEQIEVRFVKNGSVLKSVTLTDPSGDRTDIGFSNVNANIKIDEAVFADF